MTSAFLASSRARVAAAALAVALLWLAVGWALA
jgi:hypothetical protein